MLNLIRWRNRKYVLTKLRPKNQSNLLTIKDANTRLRGMGFPRIPEIRQIDGYYVLEAFLDPIRMLVPEFVSDYVAWVSICFNSIATITYDEVSGSLFFRAVVKEGEHDPIRKLFYPYVVAQIIHPELPIFAHNAYVKSLESMAIEILG